jgi:hypothetical protein
VGDLNAATFIDPELGDAEVLRETRTRAEEQANQEELEKAGSNPRFSRHMEGRRHFAPRRHMGR